MPKDFLNGPVVKTLPSNTDSLGLIPGWELRSHILLGMAKIKTREKKKYTHTHTHTHTHTYNQQGPTVEKKKFLVHPSILAWRMPWTEEPGGLQHVGSQRAEHS